MDRRNLVIDIAALAVYLVAANPAVTGIGIHEWLGLGMLVIFFVHAAMHVDWVIEAVGLYADGYYFWDPLHAMSAKLLLALMLVHVAVHWPWFAKVFKKRKEKHEVRGCE